MKMSDDRKKFYHYMFTTALEGGIGYWSFADEYSWSKGGAGAVIGTRTDIEDFDDFYAIISSGEGDWGVGRAFVAEQQATMDITEDQLLRVDLSVIKRGWRLFMENVLAAVDSEDPSAPFSRVYFRQAIVQYLTDMEDGDSDADVADLVVQLGLFGEHVYD